MRIDGSIQANLLAAVASAGRWRGRPVHSDTADHWRRLIDYGRRVERQPSGEPIGELLAQLEAEMAHVTIAGSTA